MKKFNRNELLGFLDFALNLDEGLKTCPIEHFGFCVRVIVEGNYLPKLTLEELTQVENFAHFMR